MNVSDTLTLKKKFIKSKIIFKKLEQCFLVKSAKIENVMFYIYKTAVSEANVETNGTGSGKWTFYKEWGFAEELLCFFENFVSVQEPLIES